MLLKQEISCPAEEADCHLRCVEQKLLAARDLIDSLPPVVHDWLLGRKAVEAPTSASKPTGARRGAVVLEAAESRDTKQNAEAYFVASSGTGSDLRACLSEIRIGLAVFSCVWRHVDEEIRIEDIEV